MDPTANTLRLPNGCTLYWNENSAGGRTYVSDEIGGGVLIWDTALVDQSSLLAAMAQEAAIGMHQYHMKRRKSDELAQQEVV